VSRLVTVENDDFHHSRQLEYEVGMIFSRMFQRSQQSCVVKLKVQLVTQHRSHIVVGLYFRETEVRVRKSTSKPARRISSVLSLAMMGVSASALSAGVQLVLDINQTVPAGAMGTADSDPADFVDFDGHLYFTADDGVHGRELWRSNGTAAGTQVVDINPGPVGSNPKHLFAANDGFYFFATDAQGLSQLMTLAPGSTSPVALAQLSPNCSQWVVLRDKVYVAAAQGGMQQLWTSDGTPSGTVPIIDPTTSLTACHLTVISNTLFFSGPWDQVNALWYSDATRAGTKMFNPTPAGEIFGANGLIYSYDPDYSLFAGIFRSDGTVGGTRQILAGAENRPWGGSSLSLLGVTDGRVIGRQYSYSTAPTPGDPDTERRGIFTTNGEVDDYTYLGGTSYAGFDNPGLDSYLVTPSHTFFIGFNREAGREPWVTDGTPEGSRMIRDLTPNGDSNVEWFADYNGTYLLRLVSPNGGTQLWQTDTTAEGTRLVGSSADPPTRKFAQPGVLYEPGRGPGGGDFFFVGSDELGNELYVIANDAPIAAADSAASIDGSTIDVPVLTNDSDPDGMIDTSTVRIATTPSHGTVTVAADGIVRYTPTTGYSGADSFTYIVADNFGKASTPTTVNVTVTAAPATPPPNGGGRGGGGATRTLDLFVLLAMLLAIRAGRQFTPRKNASQSCISEPRFLFYCRGPESSSVSAFRAGAVARWECAIR
jgi:ELWxxDGT repeat protein